MTRQRRLTRYERKLEQVRAKRKAAKQAANRDLRQRAYVAGMLLAIAVVVAVLLMLVSTARKAHGAVRAPLTWTAPARVGWYECRVRRPDGSVASTGLSGDSLGTLPVDLQLPGSPVRAWAVVSENWRAGATTFLVRGCNDSGCAPWSNAVVLLAAVPDTFWMLQRLGLSGYVAPIGGKVWKRAGGRVAFSLQPGDSSVAATIVHQEDVQRGARARLCETNGTWALRGVAQTCP